MLEDNIEVSIAAASDAVLSNPQNSQTLLYNGTTNKWVNAATPSAPVSSVAGRTGAITLAKSDVGLSNVDNTSDINKPISAAAQSALDAKASAATTFTGSASLIGGGTLAANRTISLVNDTPTPGNSKYYGTNSSGTKGFHDLPSGGGGSTVSEVRTAIPVTAFGAVGDDATDNTAALTAAFASGNDLYFPAGIYQVNANALAVPVSYNGIKITGAGRGKAILKRIGNGTLLRANGSGTIAGHLKNVTIRDLQFFGNNGTGTLLDLVYVDNVIIEGCFFNFTVGRAIDGVEFWDSRISNNTFEWCGDSGTNAPVIHIRNSRASSGFGYSADNCNQLTFIGNRIEAFRTTGLMIEQGINNTATPNGFYMYSNKFETFEWQTGSSIVDIASAASHVVVDGLYIWAGGFGAGSPGVRVAQALNFQGWGSELRNVLVGCSAPMLERGVRLNCWLATVVDMVRGAYDGGAPSVCHVEFAGGGPYYRRAIYVGNPLTGVDAELYSTNYMYFLPSGSDSPRTTNSSGNLQFIDAFGQVISTASSGITLSVPTNATIPYPIGTTITIIRRGTGTVAVTGLAGVTLNGSSGGSASSPAQYANVTATKIGTDEWVVG